MRNQQLAKELIGDEALKLEDNLKKILTRKDKK